MEANLARFCRVLHRRLVRMGRYGPLGAEQHQHQGKKQLGTQLRHQGSEFQMPGPGREVRLHFAGGLLGQWAVWTHRAVALFEELRELRHSRAAIPPEVRGLAAQITDANAAIFDAAHGFAGCIPGIHEVLVRQGLMDGPWCLDPAETLSPGQAAEIDRVLAAYPHLTDDEFVAAHRDEWRRGP